VGTENPSQKGKAEKLANVSEKRVGKGKSKTENSQEDKKAS